jgi:hypothetical protein
MSDIDRELPQNQQPNKICYDNGYVITNKITIAQITGTYLPSTNIEPYRLCMISMRVCDYCGKTENGDGCLLVTLPHDYLCGIKVCKSCVGLAQKNIYLYCRKNNIFPMTDDIIKNFPKQVNVKRSSGEIQKDWFVTPLTNTASINGELGIFTRCPERDTNKFVRFNDFCEWNKDCDKQKILESFEEELKRIYEQ